MMAIWHHSSGMYSNVLVTVEYLLPFILMKTICIHYKIAVWAHEFDIKSRAELRANGQGEFFRPSITALGFEISGPWISMEGFYYFFSRGMECSNEAMCGGPRTTTMARCSAASPEICLFFREAGQCLGTYPLTLFIIIDVKR